MFAHGKKIGKHLSWMPLICQAVVDRNVGVLSDLLNNTLLGTAVFDGIEKSLEYPSSVSGRFLVADLARRSIEKCGGSSLL